MITKPIKVSTPIELDIKSMSIDEIIYFRTQLEKELKHRKIKFNVGEIGETIAIAHFNKTPGLDNLQRAPVGTKNIDAISRRGERYSIKTIKEGNKSGTVYPDSEEKDKQLFEHLLVVILNEDFELKALYRFSWKQFLEVRQWDKTMNAWYIPKTLKAIKIGEKIYE